MADRTSYLHRQSMISGHSPAWAASKPPLPAHHGASTNRDYNAPHSNNAPSYHQQYQQPLHQQRAPSPGWSQPSTTARSTQQSDSEATEGSPVPSNTTPSYAAAHIQHTAISTVPRPSHLSTPAPPQQRHTSPPPSQSPQQQPDDNDDDATDLDEDGEYILKVETALQKRLQVEAARSMLQQKRMLQLPEELAPASEPADVNAAAAAAGVSPEDLASAVAAAQAAEFRQGVPNVPSMVPSANMTQEEFDAAVLKARAMSGGHVTRGLAASGVLGTAGIAEREQAVQQAAAAMAKRATFKIDFPMLVREGMLHPGRQVLEVPYKGESELADLEPDGTIVWRGQRYSSPSAFSVAVKRMYNPKRKADDGWKTVKYNGRLLEDYKLELISRLMNERTEEEPQQQQQQQQSPPRSSPQPTSASQHSAGADLSDERPAKRSRLAADSTAGAAADAGPGAGAAADVHQHQQEQEQRQPSWPSLPAANSLEDPLAMFAAGGNGGLEEAAGWLLGDGDEGAPAAASGRQWSAGHAAGFGIG